MSNQYNDPVIKALLDKVPASVRDSFTEEQLLGLKVALGARKWGRHALDVRGVLRLGRFRYYYVLLAGRERRELSRQEKKMRRMVLAAASAIFLTVSTLFGLLILYLIKSALGINLIPGFSLGIWDWFKTTFM